MESEFVNMEKVLLETLLKEGTRSSDDLLDMAMICIERYKRSNMSRNESLIKAAESMMKSWNKQMDENNKQYTNLVERLEKMEAVIEQQHETIQHFNDIIQSGELKPTQSQDYGDAEHNSTIITYNDSTYKYKIDGKTLERYSADKLLKPLVLPDAVYYWQQLIGKNYIDPYLQLTYKSPTKVAAHIADGFYHAINLPRHWQPFERLWHIDNLRQSLNRKAICHEKEVCEVNSIFKSRFVV